jgi:hypothetical protein
MGIVHDEPSRLVDRTKEICTPRFRWFEEQSRQRYIPNGTDDQVGLFWPQSKHIWNRQSEVANERGNGRSYSICGFGLELLEYLLRLRLRGVHVCRHVGQIEQRERRMSSTYQPVPPSEAASGLGGTRELKISSELTLYAHPPCRFNTSHPYEQDERGRATGE